MDILRFYADSETDIAAAMAYADLADALDVAPGDFSSDDVSFDPYI